MQCPVGAQENLLHHHEAMRGEAACNEAGGGACCLETSVPRDRRSDRPASTPQTNTRWGESGEGHQKPSGWPLASGLVAPNRDPSLNRYGTQAVVCAHSVRFGRGRARSLVLSCLALGRNEHSSGARTLAAHAATLSSFAIAFGTRPWSRQRQRNPWQGHGTAAKCQEESLITCRQEQLQDGLWDGFWGTRLLCAFC